MSKEKGIELTGIVVEALPNATFRVRIGDNMQAATEQLVLARASGKMQKNFIRIMVGDKVTVEVSPYDPSKGRITYRHKDNMRPAPQQSEEPAKDNSENISPL